MATSVNCSSNALQSVVKSRIIFLLNCPFGDVGEGKERCASKLRFFLFFKVYVREENDIGKLPPRSRDKKRVAAGDTEQETQRYCFIFKLSLSVPNGAL